MTLPVRQRTLALRSKIFGDIQLSGIFVDSDRIPVHSSIWRAIRRESAAGTGGILIRPNYIFGQNVDLSGSARSTNEFFNTSAFSASARVRVWKCRQEYDYRAGADELDVVMAKSIALRESVKLQLRVECFNLWRTTRITTWWAASSMTRPRTARCLSQLDPREFQIGAKLVF